MSSEQRGGDRLVCNARGCFQRIETTAWITSCSHVFCAQHGREAKLRQSSATAACPSCGTRFLDDLSLIERKLNHPVQLRALLLCGYSPELIMEIANNAIAFWNFQKQQICANLERKVEYYKESAVAAKASLTQQRSDAETRIRRLEQQLAQAHDRIRELNDLGGGGIRRDGEARGHHSGGSSRGAADRQSDKKRKMDDFFL